jgi:acetyl-CoA synthetase (ADP-forming)
MEILSFEETKKLLAKYKLPLCQTEIFNSKEKAAAYANKIGYPVVLKVHAQKIFHKSEVGGVKVNIKNDEELYSAWDGITRNIQGKNIEGLLVQEMVSGNEMAVGMKRDEQFGPVLMFGLGGIFIEVIQDVSLRIAPIGKKEALEMVREIRGYKILEGYRGKDPVNIDEIADIMVNISNLSVNEEQISSIDFNPVIANKKGVWIADLRIII